MSTSEMKRTVPTAHVRRFRHDPRNAGYLELDIICPYCGREHHHGAHIDAGPDFGYRASHCGATSGYRIVLTVRRPTTPRHKEETPR